MERDRIIYRIGLLIHDVDRRRRKIFNERIKFLDITLAQVWALANLSRRREGGMTQAELGEFMEVGKSTVSFLIDRLEDAGYVERRSDSTDRRTRRLHITEAGFDIIRKMKDATDDINAEIFDGITPERFDRFVNVFKCLKENLLAMDANGR